MKYFADFATIFFIATNTFTTEKSVLANIHNNNNNDNNCDGVKIDSSQNCILLPKIPTSI